MDYETSAPARSLIVVHVTADTRLSFPPGGTAVILQSFLHLFSTGRVAPAAAVAGTTGNAGSSVDWGSPPARR